MGSGPVSVEERISPGGEGGSYRRRAWLWIAGAFLLLLFPLLAWRRAPAGRRWFLPATPLDATRPDLAEGWRFLLNARDFVPAGASFTVLAPERSREMELLMMSYGLLPDRNPLPSSYFLWPHAAGRRAEYALAFRCDPRGASEALLVRRLPGGCVYRRRQGRP